MRQWVEAAREGSVRAASRLISVLEDDPTRLPEILSGLGSWPEPRLVLGLTGPPGVGKSTLVDAMLAALRKRYPERTLGVLAVDPSSPFTGGAVLGDRIRMMDHATDERIFIRSLASRGHLGGLTLGIQGSIRVMGLVGCDVVLIETVGIGQSEIEVTGVADLTLIALAPGQGDGIQMLKAGLMEAGDLFVVNKADRPGADRLVAELTATLGLTGALRKAGIEEASVLGAHRRSYAEVYRVSAAERRGIDELLDGIEACAERRRELIARRREQAVRDEIRNATLEAARRQVDWAFGCNGSSQERIDQILSGRTTVAGLAAHLMREALASLNSGSAAAPRPVEEE